MPQAPAQTAPAGNVRLRGLEEPGDSRRSGSGTVVPPRRQPVGADSLLLPMSIAQPGPASLPDRAQKSRWHTIWATARVRFRPRSESSLRTSALRSTVSTGSSTVRACSIARSAPEGMAVVHWAKQRLRLRGRRASKSSTRSEAETASVASLRRHRTQARLFVQDRPDSASRSRLAPGAASTCRRIPKVGDVESHSRPQVDREGRHRSCNPQAHRTHTRPPRSAMSRVRARISRRTRSAGVRSRTGHRAGRRGDRRPTFVRPPCSRTCSSASARPESGAVASTVRRPAHAAAGEAVENEGRVPRASGHARAAVLDRDRAPARPGASADRSITAIVTSGARRRRRRRALSMRFAITRVPAAGWSPRISDRVSARSVTRAPESSVPAANTATAWRTNSASEQLLRGGGGRHRRRSG